MRFGRAPPHWRRRLRGVVAPAAHPLLHQHGPPLVHPRGAEPFTHNGGLRGFAPSPSPTSPASRRSSPADNKSSRGAPQTGAGRRTGRSRHGERRGSAEGAREDADLLPASCGRARYARAPHRRPRRDAGLAKRNSDLDYCLHLGGHKLGGYGGEEELSLRRATGEAARPEEAPQRRRLYTEPRCKLRRRG